MRGRRRQWQRLPGCLPVWGVRVQCNLAPCCASVDTSASRSRSSALLPYPPQINPAVTLSLLLSNNLGLLQAVANIAAQIAGAILGAGAAALGRLHGRVWLAPAVTLISACHAAF